MKRKITFLIAALFALTLITQQTMLWGQERGYTVAYTLTPETNSASASSAYDQFYDFTINGVTWSVKGNTNMDPWRIGGKKSTINSSTGTGDRPLYTKGTISDNISKIVISHGNSSSDITVNSITLIVSTAQDGGGTVISSLTGSYTNNTSTTFERPVDKDWSGRYYKIVYNVTNTTTTQRYVLFAEAVFYKTTYTLTYTPSSAGGTINVTDGEDNDVESGTALEPGTVLNIAAVANSGYVFNGWSVTGNSSIEDASDDETTLILGTANETLSASFVSAGEYITVAPSTNNVYCSAGTANFTLSTNIASPSYAVQFYTTSECNETATKPGWLGNPSFGEGTLSMSVSPNTGAARSTYFKVYSGTTYSSVVTINQAEYTVTPPTLEASSHFDYTKTVSITAATGTTVRYTTNGDEPGLSSTIYSAPFEISATTTVKAKAYDAGNTASSMVSATYTRDYDFISSITTTTSSSPKKVKGTVVAISTAGYIVGDGTGYIYNFKSSHDKSVGDKVTLNNDVYSYGHVLELKDDSPGTATTSNYESDSPTPIDGDDFAAYFSGLHRSDYVVVEGVLTYADSKYTVGVSGDDTYGLLINNTTSGQSTTLNGYKNQTVRVTGYFSGFNTNNDSPQYFTIMFESISTPPVINASNKDIAYTATSASIPFTISNPVAGGTTSAAEKTDVDWITNVSVDGSNVIVTTTANDGNAREAYITITYTYNTSLTVTKDVKVHQAGVPSLSLDRYTVEVIYTAGNSTFDITYESLDISDNENFDVVYYASNGTDVISKPGWISHTITGNNSDGYILTITATQNDSDSDRYAYFKLYAIDESSVEEYSPLVTLTQLAPRSFTATVGSHSNGSLLVNDIGTSISIQESTIVTVTAVANEGYRLTRLYYHPTGDESDQTDIDLDDKAFIMPSENITVVAVYTIVYAITCNVSPETVATIVADEAACSGDVVTVLIDDITTGYNFVSLAITKTSDGSASGITPTGNINTGFTFNMPAYPVTVTATFAIAYTWDLSTNSYDSSPSETLIQWSSACATMKNERNGISNTAVNNYIPTTNTSTRMYKGNKLTITPATNYSINKVVFTATTTGYATTLAGSTWTNATASSSSSIVTVTPTTKTSAFNAVLGNTVGFTSVAVYYEFIVPVNGDDEMTANVTVPANYIYEVSSHIVIPEGKILTVNGTIVNDNPANLVIEDGGQLILKSTNAGVQATFQKDIANASAKGIADHWYTISTPTGGIDVDDVVNLVNNAGGDLQYNLFRYKESTHMWEAYNPSNHVDFTTLEKGRGYLYRNNGKDLEFPGEVNVGDVTVHLTNTSSNGDLRGFNLIGNPYGHNIYKGAVAAIADAKLNDGFYYLTNEGGWHTGTYETVITPKMGILVQLNNSYEELDLTITDKPNAATAERYANDNLMFTVSNKDYEDVTYAMFHKGYGLNKINHRNADIPMLYINHDNDDYAIAMLSDDTKAFNLCFKAKTTGQYKLTYKAEGEFSYLHIIDRLTGNDVDMLLEGEYNFIGTPHDNENRFIVSLGYLPDYGEGNNDIFAFQNGSDILVSGQGELQIFDVTGRIVKNMNINGAETINVQTQGVYILRLVGTEVKTQKIVVK